MLVKAGRYTDSNLEMPPVKPLSREEVARIETWVRMGAPGPKEVDIRATDESSDPIAGKDHWAFKSLGSPPLPNPKSNDWASNSIDRFILERLESSGLRPVKNAEPRDLLRRLNFRLTGLPPSSQEVQDFLDDKEPDAMERVVDRLLASPRFGERWGRHWLDLARYADSNGLDENFLFREAWRYRNRVISSLNDDMPFDRFLLEQIAGDLLPYDSIEQRDQQRIAAGFLVIGPKVLLGNNEKRQRMEVADEQLDTIGKAILGHPHAFTMWMAGGGVKGGLTYGSTDEFGYYPVENPVHMHDLHATLLHGLGLDHKRLTYRYAGRDFRLTEVHGNVVNEIWT